jgi:hypothetical protein
MSVTPPPDPALDTLRARPLRLVPTLTAIGLAVALGSLITGTCTVGLQRVGASGAPGMAPLSILAMWVFAAGCVYAANRQGLGRTREERLSRFALCLGIAMPVCPIIAILGIDVFFALGGHP